MTLYEALEEVREAAKEPRRVPAGETWVERGGVELLKFLGDHPVRNQVAHENLTPAQETVCRWVWDTMARHWKSFEAFEAGFLYDYHVDHELALWVRMASVFEQFSERHPSANKRETVEALCHVASGILPVMLGPKRAKEARRTVERRGADELMPMPRRPARHPRIAPLPPPAASPLPSAAEPEGHVRPLGDRAPRPAAGFAGSRVQGGTRAV